MDIGCRLCLIIGHDNHWINFVFRCGSVSRLAGVFSLCIAVLLSGCGGGNDLPTTTLQSNTVQRFEAKHQGGMSQDLIVVFDDSAIERNAEAFQQKRDLTSSHPDVQSLKREQLSSLKETALSLFEPSELKVMTHYSHLPISHVRVSSQGQLDKLNSQPGILGVYENVTHNRSMLAQSLPLISQPQAVANGKQGTGTAVVVLDNRVDYSQPAFGSCSSPGVPANCKVLYAQDVAGLPNDGLGFQEGHGTNVAATVLAVAPGTKIIGINVFNGTGASSTDVIKGINWAVAHVAEYNIAAINMSLGSGKYTQPESASPYFAAFRNLRAAGIVPVVAAGNDGFTNALSSPASVVGAVSVGAVYDSAFGPRQGSCLDSVTAADKVTCFSNSATFLTVLAPGCRDDAGIAPRSICGTSQAAPHVAGSVAVLRSAFPTETVDQTVSRLRNGDNVTDTRNGLMTPRLNLAKALALPSCSYSLSVGNIAISASGAASNSVSVLTPSGCAWSAISTQDWITVTSASAGIGGGAIAYAVSANNSSSTRTGSISIGGLTFSISQAAGAASVSSASGVWLEGGYRAQLQGLSAITLSADRISNYSRSRSTGTLRLELWLTRQVETQQLTVPGWRVATYQLAGSSNGSLGPYQYFSNVSGTVPLVNLPPPGAYFLSLIVSEYSSSCGASDHFCPDALGNFNGQFFIPDATAPSVPSALLARPAGPAQINLSWNASLDDVGVTSYKIYSGGKYIGSVASNSATVAALLPSTQYRFSVSACDDSENCSAQGSAATATTPMAIQSGVWWNPLEGGRGFTVDVSGNTLSFAAFLYDPSGRATWYTSSGKFNSDGSYDGRLQELRGGQALTGSYRVPTLKSDVSALHLSCTSPTSCTMNWAGGNVPIQRYVFGGAPANNAPTSGTWWNPAEGGRGYVIEVQGNVMSFSAFLYDANGNATWYLSSGTLNADGSYDGQLLEMTNGQALGSAYKAPAVKGTASNMHLACTSATTCTLTWAGGAVPIQKYLF